MPSKRVRLAQFRRAVGLSQEGLAHVLGVERSTVGRWESAETDPQPWVRPKLAQALKIAPSDLQTLLEDVVFVGRKPDERMTYLLEHPASADLVAVGHLRERIHQLDKSYDEVPSAALLGPAGQVHGQVSYLREHARDSHVRRVLLGVESESAIFMGQVIWDASQRRDQAGPYAHFDEAIQAARQIRDPAGEAYATLRKSYIALYGEKNAGKGVDLAEQSAALASVHSPSLAGLSLLHAAEGHAMRGNVKDCESALLNAETQLDRVDECDVAAGSYTVDEFNRLAGSCYLFLGQPDRAEPVLRDTVSAHSGKTKRQAIALSNLTLSLVRQRKLDEASATMHKAIDAVERTRGGAGLNLVFSAGRELRRWRNEPWVHDIDDRLIALMASV
ncbi:MAG TPA: helix-turn-helix transcriptional regulator [Actinocrinis sp.]|uniref:helix-turn-helix transcriptional regulator n=1 Tax=Actinocrinis sp. TaxID=1920516 RepID=UPI002DDCC9D1|nr:helix-turn-helix transcriptional regulator [Actinocrinis sp.]HEV3169352.1 helix-turn-helix transcriptional regulator [Actinocrinis sp.]